METLKAAGLEHYILWAPQCPSDQRWTDVDWKAVVHTMKKNPTWPMEVLMHGIDSLVTNSTMIDTTRMYIAGLSMGGYGTWEYIARQPYRFASAMPVCGGGDIVQAKNNKQTAVWAFHGKADNVVPYENSVRMVNATKKVNTNVHLISYPDVKHDSWNRAFAERKIVRDFISIQKK
jgi:predicted peptidase